MLQKNFITSNLTNIKLIPIEKDRPSLRDIISSMKLLLTRVWMHVCLTRSVSHACLIGPGIKSLSFVIDVTNDF